VTLKVNEIFYSIQGESLYAGLLCVFVRLAGCNLRCTYCDTPYAYDEGRIMTIEEIIQKVASYHCRLVEITGGEPLIQEASPALILRLIEKDYTVLLETNGSCDINSVDQRCSRIVDIKCPGSGESGKNDLDNLSRLTPKDQLKFVITDKTDYDYAIDLLHTPWTPPFPVPVLFSAAAPHLSHTQLAEWILADHLNVRIQVQLHKILWPGEERGR
jgi:7-carboxy-7-deazaguanine synthase